MYGSSGPTRKAIIPFNILVNNTPANILVNPIPANILVNAYLPTYESLQQTGYYIR